MGQLEKLQDDAFNVLEVLEDAVAHVCDDKKLSGQKVWAFVKEFATLKTQEFPEPFTIKLED
tara:strand:- start:830 stop:1015 length:186 start_codon:yes stop_codon:yes gene_type:complete